MTAKFRAWLRAEKRMYPVAYIHWEGGNIVEIGLEGLTEDDNGYEVYDVVEPKDCDLMQSTGLKDENGVEIFEGDILTGEYVVTFISGSFDIVKQSCCIHCKNGHSSHGGVNEYVATSEIPVVVIGNIHQNPELLRAEEMEGKR